MSNRDTEIQGYLEARQKYLEGALSRDEFLSIVEKKTPLKQSASQIWSAIAVSLSALTVGAATSCLWVGASANCTVLVVCVGILVSLVSIVLAIATASPRR
jgi:hypothetical protein